MEHNLDQGKHLGKNPRGQRGEEQSGNTDHPLLNAESTNEGGKMDM